MLLHTAAIFGFRMTCLQLLYVCVPNKFHVEHLKFVLYPSQLNKLGLVGSQTVG
jgi:hypothetical protein